MTIDLNERLLNYLNSTDDEFKDMSIKELTSIMTYYLRTLPGSKLSKLIFNPSGNNKLPCLLFVSDIKEELSKPLNPNLVFKFVYINNERHWRLLYRILNMFTNVHVNSDSDTMYAIDVLPLLTLLKTVKYNLHSITLSETSSNDLSKIYIDVFQKDNTIKPKLISFVINDYYIRALLKQSYNFYNSNIKNHSKYFNITKFDIDSNVGDYVDEGDSTFYTIQGNVVTNELNKLYSDSIRKNRIKQIKLLVPIDILPSKVYSNSESKSENYISVFSIKHNNTEDNKSNNKIVWKWVHTFKNDDVIVDCFRPFSYMIV